DFTFTDVTSKALQNLPEYDQVMAIADLDIDNDGDLDLYLARGRAFEGGFGESPSLDSDPIRKEMSIRSRGYKGVDEFDFVTDGKIKLHNYYYLSQGPFRGEVYSVFLGNTKRKHMLKSAEELQIDSTMAKGWPQDISKNGLYFGYLGQNKWKAALVRNGNLFWSYRFSLAGVTDVSPKFRPQNRNEPDILLRNDDGVFTDVSKSWNLPPGGNALGVTVGDFNNDSHQDVFVYRWGFIGSRTADYILLNTGKGNFETFTMHGANDIERPGNGDMGQAFDFDLDGDLDLLNGSEGGEWYLYENKLPGTGNSMLVRVGYAPESNVDAIAAEVIVKTPEQEYRKRVGSAGEVFSQSLMNIVHFGLGDATSIARVQVRWRNGETIAMHDMPINTIIDTDNVHPKSINIVQKTVEVRKGTSMQLTTEIEPINANKEVVWSSSDTEVLQVDTNGVVTAIGDVGQTETITAKSAMNDLLATCEVAIVDWFSMPIEKVELNQSDLELVENQKVNLQTTVIPKYADDPSLNWKSTDATAAKVDENGVITALKSGETTIKVTSNANNAITDTIQVTVKPVVEPYAKILNKEQLEQPIVGNSITVTAKYHAGTGNTVINADEGGVRIWLRHFKNEWFPIKDVVLVDEKALNTVSGQVTQTFSLKDYIPTAELPEGQFYQMRVTFTASDGNMYDDVIYPLNIVEKEKTP
ncbi:MAG: Ig-like domain-containing protein, partial [Bacteroidota bacterium]